VQGGLSVFAEKAARYQCHPIAEPDGSGSANTLLPPPPLAASATVPRVTRKPPPIFEARLALNLIIVFLLLRLIISKSPLSQAPPPQTFVRRRHPPHRSPRINYNLHVLSAPPCPSEVALQPYCPGPSQCWKEHSTPPQHIIPFLPASPPVKFTSCACTARILPFAMAVAVNMWPPPPYFLSPGPSRCWRERSPPFPQSQYPLGIEPRGGSAPHLASPPFPLTTTSFAQLARNLY
jgi:hypothetical protein